MTLGQAQFTKRVVKECLNLPVADSRIYTIVLGTGILRKKVEVVHPVLRIEINAVGQLTLQHETGPAQPDVLRVGYGMAQNLGTGIVLLVPQPDLVQEAKFKILAPIRIQVPLEWIRRFPVCITHSRGFGSGRSGAIASPALPVEGNAASPAVG